MIDIHSHLIFDVDDGSKSLEQSLKYLEEARKMGIKKIICTPHMCHGFRQKAVKIVNNFKILKEEAKKYDIDLYLGNEIMMTNETVDLLKNKKITSLNRSKYLLVEFKRNENINIDNLIEMLEDLLDSGYMVILAHPELYINYRNLEYMKKIKESGIMLQMDATSILRGYSDIKTRNFSKKLLNNQLIDFIASDTHCTKTRNYTVFKKSYLKIKRKNKEYAELLFETNPNYIIEE